MSNCLSAQDSSIDEYLDLKTDSVPAGHREVQEYDVTVKWQNLDPITSNKISSSAVTAKYTCGLDNGFVKWGDVQLFNIDDFKQKTENGNRLNSFDEFIYKPDFFSFSKEEYFLKIPPEHKELATWFILDAIQMDGITNIFFDSLTFNEAFYPALLDDFTMRIDNGIHFKSQSAKFLWSGITKYNNEPCAIVKFESLQNPVEMDLPGYSFKGRSLYWGEIWISLNDKQFEFAVMDEDIIIKLDSPNFPQGQLINMQREIVFNKVK